MIRRFRRWGYAPLFIVVGLIGLVLLVLWQTQLSHRHESGTDKPIAIEVAASYLYVNLVLLIATRRWQWIAAGLFATTTADALLYFVIFGGKVGWVLPPILLDIVRSCLIVGGPVLDGAVTVWAIKHWRTPAALVNGHDTEAEP